MIMPNDFVCCACELEECLRTQVLYNCYYYYCYHFHVPHNMRYRYYVILTFLLQSWIRYNYNQRGEIRLILNKTLKKTCLSGYVEFSYAWMKAGHTVCCVVWHGATLLMHALRRWFGGFYLLLLYFYHWQSHLINQFSSQWIKPKEYGLS